MRLAVWCIVSVLVGAVVVYALSPDPIAYPEVIVPAARIIEREVPGEVRWRDRIVYRYISARQTATAPEGAREDVAAFCAPVVALVRGDTVQAPRREVIRSVVLGRSWFPLSKDPLLVTSMDNRGDLFSRDYRVPGQFGLGSGDTVVVRYPRWAPIVEMSSDLLAVYGAVSLAFTIFN